MKQLSLQGVLEGIEDTRRERSVWYPLYEVLFIMMTTVICGATPYFLFISCLLITITLDGGSRPSHKKVVK